MALKPIAIEVQTEVSGQDDVRGLAAQLEALADTLEGDLKTQALASAQALRELGAKQGAIDNFVKLKAEAGGAAERLREAQEAAQKLGREMAASGSPTRAQTGQLEKLRDAVRTAKAEVQSKTVALDQSRAALNRYGIGTNNLAQSERNLRAAIAGARAEMAQLVPATSAAGKEVEVVSSRTAGLAEQLAILRNIAGAALGGTLVGSLAKDLADVADGYDNLSARIKLATGEGQAFESALSEVQRVALETSSNLDATGTLFARLADAGRSAGQSAQEAQTDALGLAQTINEAIQLSGASSQAAQAAVTQLIQGLNAGVLRGEEFNSVVEQSPRLAKAMADGLGVTIGQLRNMAQAGQLTATVVRDALRGQADVVRSEFEQLPPTVGRAIENLSTAWTVYVGEVNNATGASKTAAQAIKALADNLETVMGLLMDLGQAAAAFAALRLAQQFLGIGAAASTSAAAIAANTAALAAAGSAGTGAAAGAGRFAAALSSIKTFGLLAILTNLEDIGVAIGEGIAKLQGYKDKTEELAQAERSRALAAQEGIKIAAAQEAANKAARDSQFELTRAAQETIEKFEEMRSKGQSAGEAVAAIGKDFDLASLPGIANAAGVLDKLVADGKLSADQMRQAWVDALNGEDLLAFEVKARAALSGTARESERLAQIMDASLREAIRRSGADFDVLAGGMTKATRSAINDTDTIIASLDRLKDQGVNVGQALEASISKGISTADSQAGVEALRARIEGLRDTLGEKVADGLLQQLRNQAVQSGLALDKITWKAEEVAAAFERAGIKTKAALQQAAESARQDYELIKASGQANAQDLATAWQRAAQAAIDAAGGIAPSWVQAQADAAGYTTEIDEAGKATLRLKEATDLAGGAASGAAGDYDQMGRSAKGAADNIDYLNRVSRGGGGGPGPGGRRQPGGSPGAAPGGKPADEQPKDWQTRMDERNAAVKSQYGSTREERLAGQNAVDNTLMFALRDKLKAGLLTDADLPALQAVLAANADNEKIARSMGPSGWSNEARADWNAWQATMALFQQQVSRLGGGAGPAVGKRVDMRINVDGAESYEFQTDEQGEDEVERLLRRLKQDKKRSARR